MPTLIITRGLPGSGKSTRAEAWVREDDKHRGRINRDMLRIMMHGGYVDQERQITAARNGAVRELLQTGVDVIVDDTTLPLRTARELRNLATLAGADFEVWDMTDVPLEVCIERDRQREATVGEEVIRDMHKRLIAGKPWPLPIPAESDLHHETGELVPYVSLPGAPQAVLVDIDGTVALKGDRSPYDETRVHEDRPNLPVIAAVQAMAAAGYRIIFCSGRTDACRTETVKWIHEHVGSGIDYEALYMRPAGDQRKDSIVKAEIFDREIRDNYDVLGVFDDRAQVVRMWRSLGLTVFQVAEGNF